MFDCRYWESLRFPLFPDSHRFPLFPDPRGLRTAPRGG